MTKSKEDKTLESICAVVDKVQRDMGLTDWTFEVEYLPEEDSNSIAEVEYTKHREATIKIYDFNPKRIYRDVAHEMGHCVIGKLVQYYEGMISVQREVIDQLLQDEQEEVVDRISRIMESQQYSPNKNKKR